MYVELTDETGNVSSAIIEQTEKLLAFAADYLKLPKSKEMSVTFVENARSREINKELRDTDAPTDVISLEYKPDADFYFDDDEEADVQELLEELDPFIGELFINVDRAAEQAADYGHSIEREYGWLCVHGFLHINGYDHYTPEDEAEMFGLQEEILTAYGLSR
ncbi:rRNA maturation RNase YbeY [Lactovum odontotermitis]